MAEKLFPVGEFARLSGTTLAALHYYDKIGLLTPVIRGENRYRYYGFRQLARLNVIRTLQEMGMTLSEIKVMQDCRDPQLTDRVFSVQDEIIGRKIDELKNARQLLKTLRREIRSALEADIGVISVKYVEAEPIILGEPNDYSKNRDDYDALYSFYHDMAKKQPGLNLNYPVWGMFEQESIERGRFSWPDRYYFYNPRGKDSRPAGLYAIGCEAGGYGQGGGLCRRILDYIAQNGYELNGRAYEEYPINEISVTDDANYLRRFMVSVRESGKS